MKKFILNIFILIGCVALIFGVNVFIVFKVMSPQYSNYYNAAILDKTERLKMINGPKIILVGNSNVSFGIESKIIEDELQMPVVNLGLHGGLGNRFHENIAKLNIDKGDLVILCHSEYDSDSIGDLSLAWITIENYYELWKLINVDEYPGMLSALPKYMLDVLQKWALDGSEPDLDGYVRNDFNEYGDVSYSREKCKYTFSEGTVGVPTISNTTVKRINNLNKYCEERGAWLLIAGYPIADCIYTPSENEYKIFQEQLERKVECDVISDFTDYFIAQELFYDTHLHLTNEGARLRTQQLVEDLKNWIGSNNYNGSK